MMDDEDVTQQRITRLEERVDEIESREDIRAGEELAEARSSGDRRWLVPVLLTAVNIAVTALSIWLHR